MLELTFAVKCLLTRFQGSFTSASYLRPLSRGSVPPQTARECQQVDSVSGGKTNSSHWECGNNDQRDAQVVTGENECRLHYKNGRDGKERRSAYEFASKVGYNYFQTS